MTRKLTPDASALSRRDFLRLSAGAACFTAVPLASLAARGQGKGKGRRAAKAAAATPFAGAPAQRPNVILILTDDQGYADFSCHGNPLLKTPNMDRLHDEGVRFTDFHVAPMCTPTRSQLLTGVDCLRNMASSVCAGRGLIRPEIPTAAQIFKAGGYRTGHFGKWHLGDSYPNLPHQKGFDETFYFNSFGISSLADTWCNDYFDPHVFHAKAGDPNRGEMKQMKGYCTDVWFGEAMKWIRERAAAKEPFFVYLPTNAPHGPLWCPAEYRARYAGKVPPAVASFFGMIANIDDNLGKMEEMLKETGLRDNTIVILINDNGGTAGVKFYNAGMRSGKTTYYDGGHRAACFIRWPGGSLIKPADVDVLSENQDILPTLIDLCGLEKPAAAKFDGMSLAGYLKGAEKEDTGRMLVVHYGQRPVPWEGAVMWKKWRLVKGTELYNLAEDPHQEKDVAAQNPEVLKKMRDHYEQWWAGISPRIDDLVPIVIGADLENPVCLTSTFWSNVYCDNMTDLRRGKQVNSWWNVETEKDGEYTFGLRRWPREADAAIAAGVPEFKAKDGSFPEGQALPIVKARLTVGDTFDQSLPVKPEDKEIVFKTTLKGGAKTKVQTYFYDAQGQELCGAYYTYVQRA